MSRNPSPQKVNLYLIGFMGVGKSAVGRGVAQALGYRFIDSDRAIERKAGKQITRIFSEDGEPAFRQMEREFIEDGHPATGCVVACGGGLPTIEGMREKLLARGVVVCLFASEDTILERTSRNKKRPLLRCDNPRERISELLNKRLPVYRSTGTGILTENRGLSEVIDHVVRVYKSEAERFSHVHSGVIDEGSPTE